MTVVVTASGQSTGRVLLDLVESWNGFHHVTGGNSNNQPSDWRGTVFDPAGGTVNSLFPTITGVLAALSFDATVGRMIHNYTSIAGNSALAGQTGSGFYGIPLYQRFSQANSIPPAIFPRPFRRYRLDFLVRGTVGPGAGVDCAIGISGNVATSGVTGGATDTFFGWCAVNGLNGGRWTPRSRIVAAGAFINGPDSGFPFIPAPVRFQQLSVVYEEGLTPRVRFLIDGAELHQIAGDANMPQIFSHFPTKAMGNGAGATAAQFAETRFRVEEI